MKPPGTVENLRAITPVPEEARERTDDRSSEFSKTLSSRLARESGSYKWLLESQFLVSAAGYHYGLGRTQ